MKIQDAITITELSRLMNRSRPTIYKYISDYESGEEENLPVLVRNLFDQIVKDTITKKELIAYCKDHFSEEGEELFPSTKEIISLISKNQSRLNLEKLKKQIEKELEK